MRFYQPPIPKFISIPLKLLTLLGTAVVLNGCLAAPLPVVSNDTGTTSDQPTRPSPAPISDSSNNPVSGQNTSQRSQYTPTKAELARLAEPCGSGESLYLNLASQLIYYCVRGHVVNTSTVKIGTIKPVNPDFYGFNHKFIHNVTTPDGEIPYTGLSFTNNQGNRVVVHTDDPDCEIRMVGVTTQFGKSVLENVNAGWILRVVNGNTAVNNLEPLPQNTNSPTSSIPDSTRPTGIDEKKPVCSGDYMQRLVKRATGECEGDE
jgi:hypothetical protein